MASYLQHAIDGIDANSEVCLRSPRSGPCSKTSLPNINEAINMELQVNFAFVYFGTQRHTNFVKTDTGTRFTEAFLAENRSAGSKAENRVHIWIFWHEARSLVSGNDEFHKGSNAEHAPYVPQNPTHETP